MQSYISLIGIASVLLCASGKLCQAQVTEPISFSYKRFDKLSEAEKQAFHRVYREDVEANEKLGGKAGWILGEAPGIPQESLAHFPLNGRLRTSGTLNYPQGNEVEFTTGVRKYLIRDRYLVHRLKELGVEKRKPIRVVLDAYWVNFEKTTGYTLVYLHSVKFEDGRPGFSNQGAIVPAGAAVPFSESTANSD